MKKLLLPNNENVTVEGTFYPKDFAGHIEVLPEHVETAISLGAVDPDTIPAEEVVEDSELDKELKATLAGNVGQVQADILAWNDEGLVLLAAMEAAHERPRKGVLEAIEAEQAKRADANK